MVIKMTLETDYKVKCAIYGKIPPLARLKARLKRLFTVRRGYVKIRQFVQLPPPTNAEEQ